MDDHTIDRQLRNRVELLESADSAPHLVGDLALRDIILTVAGLVVAIIAMVWWAY